MKKICTILFIITFLVSIVAINAYAKGNVMQIGQDSFDKNVIHASKSTLVIVDFYASWCGPCKYVAPILKEIAADRNDVRIVKVDVDKNTSLSTKFNIKSIPTLLFFKNGKNVETLTGARSKKDYNTLIDKWVNKTTSVSTSKPKITAQQYAELIYKLNNIKEKDPSRQKQILKVFLQRMNLTIEDMMDLKRLAETDPTFGAQVVKTYSQLQKD